ncbi:MAG TPA: 50S ribosomal protein L6 [bacterium]|nr:50S ribosomal protein L6 [bacterium]
MSRIGKKPIIIPEKVEVTVQPDLIIIKGPKGELKQKLVPSLKISQKEKEISVNVSNPDEKKQRALWGTMRQIISNMIKGVSEGFEEKLEINGVGYKAELKGENLMLNVGYSHPVEFKTPKNIKIGVEKNLITITGFDKQLVGETAAQIRKIKKPEPYKGKGIKYVSEVIRRKAGKQAKSAK